MTGMNLSGVIGSLPSTILAVTRRGAGSYVKGRHTGGATEDLSIKAIVYPAGDRELRRLPEAMRTIETMGVVAGEILRTANESDGTQADRFVHGGRTYEVRAIEAYGDIAGFWHALAQKVA